MLLPLGVEANLHGIGLDLRCHWKLRQEYKLERDSNGCRSTTSNIAKNFTTQSKIDALIAANKIQEECSDATTKPDKLMAVYTWMMGAKR